MKVVAFLLSLAVASSTITTGLAAEHDIVETAVAAGNFKTLATALKEADLIETLKGKGPFTVFAPTDEAFAKLPKGTLQDLLKPENNKKLAGILNYHVVPGKVMAADVAKITQAKTVQGSDLKIHVINGKVMVDNANVTSTDISCTNGVIHVIDAVLMPTSSTHAPHTNTTVGNREKVTTYLGLGVEPLHPAFWAHMRDVIEQKQGVLVTQVASNSPAEKAGIKPHDILLTYGDQKLFSPKQLVALVQADKSGREVQLGIVREGKSQTINVTLAEHALASPTEASAHNSRQPSEATPQDKRTDLTSFDSLAIKSLGRDQYQVEVGYEDKDGKIVNRKFEGTQEEIKRDILALKDLPANEQADLLRALNMRNLDPRFDSPKIFFTPDGRMIWEFDDLDTF